MPQETLKPCPFCGGKAEFFASLDNPQDDDEIYWNFINCEVCKCRTQGQKTKRRAFDIWNRRVK